MSESVLSQVYAELVKQTAETVTEPLAAYEEVIKSVDSETSPQNSRLDKARAYVKRLAVAKEPGSKSLGSFFIDGAHFTLDDVR